jgi:tetratricopeptide (TPR) repeat protein
VRLLRQAIAAGSRSALTHAHLAALLVETGDGAAAAAEIERAVELEPENATILATAAECLERIGRIEDALDMARRAAARAPGDAHTGVVLAGLERRTGAREDARARLEALLGRDDLSTTLRVRALNQLGLALDRLGAHDAAFDAFTEQGRETLKDPVAERIDRGFWPRRIAEYRAAVDTLPWSSWTPAEAADRRRDPAFLVGFPRSGTTMTEQVLAAHPDVVSSDERPLVPAMRVELRSMFDDQGDVAALLPRVTGDQLVRLRELYWHRAEETVGAIGARLFVDKLPLNIVDLPLVNAVFPGARVILALRDPRDVCLSCFMQSFRLNQAMIHFLSLESTAALYEQVMGLWLAMRGHLTLPVLEVRYEDTVADLPGQARRLLDFLDVPWDERVLSFHERAADRVISTPSAAAVAEPVYTRAVSRWRRYEAHVADVAERLRPFVETWGYGQDGPDGAGH